jgi:hypothetical protein
MRRNLHQPGWSRSSLRKRRRSRTAVDDEIGAFVARDMVALRLTLPVLTAVEASATINHYVKLNMTRSSNRLNEG